MMLLYSLLVACSGGDAPPVVAPATERKHHVERTDRTEADDAEVAEGAGGGNRPPKVRRITISPTTPSKRSTMKVDVDATDPEGQELTTSYHWKVNGSEVFGHDSPELELADRDRGDTVNVEVEVTDGVSKVRGNSETYTIGNADPELLDPPGPDDKFDGLHLHAEDPDGDDVTWKLQGGPPGATIDKMGYLHYVGTREDKGGSYTIKVVVEDGHGGKTTLELPLSVSAGSVGAPPPPGVPQ